jgi:hypothetical protein
MILIKVSFSWPAARYAHARGHTVYIWAEPLNRSRGRVRVALQPPREVAFPDTTTERGIIVHLSEEIVNWDRPRTFRIGLDLLPRPSLTVSLPDYYYFYAKPEYQPDPEPEQTSQAPDSSA